MTVLVPDGLPSLARGGHMPGSGHACIMEMVSVLAGEQWSDSPKCVHPMLAVAAVMVNDSIPDADRQLLVPLIGRFFNTSAVRSATLRDAFHGYLLDHAFNPNVVANCIASERSNDSMVAQTAFKEKFLRPTMRDRIAITINGLVFSHGCSCPECVTVENQSKEKVAWLSGLLDVYDEVSGRTAVRELTASDVTRIRDAVRA